MNHFSGGTGKKFLLYYNKNSIMVILVDGEKTWIKFNITNEQEQ